MSYGRTPHYIFAGKAGEADGFTFMEPSPDWSSVFVAYDAVAQLITSMEWRHNGELEALIARGRQLRPDLTDRPFAGTAVPMWGTAGLSGHDGVHAETALCRTGEWKPKCEPVADVVERLRSVLDEMEEATSYYIGGLHTVIHHKPVRDLDERFARVKAVFTAVADLPR